jgi:hypothetical protein
MLAAGMAFGFHEPAEKELPVMIHYMGNTLVRRFLSGR